jgi:hypothetical protein
MGEACSTRERNEMCELDFGLNVKDRDYLGDVYGRITEIHIYTSDNG